MDIGLVTIFTVKCTHDWWAFVAGADLAAVLVSLESKLAAHSASNPWTRSWLANANVAPVVVCHETMFAEHCAHKLWANWRLVTDACVTSIVICLVPVFTEQGAHDWWALFACTYITTVVISLESIWTGHSAFLL